MIILTTAAILEIKKRLELKNNKQISLRLGIKGSGGCNGFQYIIMFEHNSPSEKDIQFTINDINILIDKKSLVILNGTTLDYETTLMKSGFKFINPGEKSKCGCGSSFTI